ncbi:hypothetical protein JYP49_22060 [Nitratireductor aquimarinus]|uniref:hypothetical protein n=1 Tax=Nitratireductor TaxID=245876 RepID=UPI0019D355AA|nr:MULTISPECIES: hypothetical protein [Nitratireductor]MBN7778950.1 hypothetical protein [Nitratireductor pacificus]MBN7783270.1 hypothetical protein [Nitratireductor pacificus]MBN7792078.1 hypothetical protein [Nitratireductor aquimarinus]MBY6101338.1 hypothetical protein [Nitratireductor aquimarinus]MCA1263287.1 hypothetical protein [Nitratireductor aquimarinus]
MASPPPPLTKRQRHVLFLQGALNRVAHCYTPPARPDALAEFLLGGEIVDCGYIAITDLAGAKSFIDDIRTGRRPIREEAHG